MGNRPPVVAYAIFLLLGGVWGSSFLLIKYGLEHFSAAEVGSLRIVIAFLFMLPFALARISRLKRADLLWLFLSGLLGNLIPSLLFAYAEQVVSSSVAGVLNSLTPIFTLVVAMTLFGKRFFAAHLLGIALGLVGAVMLVISADGNDGGFAPSYAMLVVLATILYAFNLNIVKNKLAHLHPVHITAFAFLLVGPLALAFLAGFTPVVTNLNKPDALEGLLYVSILAIAGSALALMLFNHLIQMTNVVFSSSVTYLIPIVAVIAGAADGESFKPVYVLWIMCILAGVFLVNKKPGSRFNKGK
jgi:drug/metabolite transporter (DMT)-like permease